MLLSHRFRIHRQISYKIMVKVRARTRLACIATLLVPIFFLQLWIILCCGTCSMKACLLLVRKVRGHKTITEIFQHVWTYLSSNKHFLHLWVFSVSTWNSKLFFFSYSLGWRNNLKLSASFSCFFLLSTSPLERFTLSISLLPFVYDNLSYCLLKQKVMKNPKC